MIERSLYVEEKFRLPESRPCRRSSGQVLTASGSLGWHMNRNGLPPVAAIDAKVTVNCNNDVTGIKFAHAFKTEIG